MVETDLNTEEEYNQQSVIIKRLIKKLIKDNVLISFDDGTSQDPAVIAHPDFVLDEGLSTQ
jgi:hypothetical protein